MACKFSACFCCACRQYQNDVHRIGLEEMAKVVGETWKSLSVAEKQPYEEVAKSDMATFLQNKRIFEGLHRQYSQLHYAAQEAGETSRCAFHEDPYNYCLKAFAVLISPL